MNKYKVKAGNFRNKGRVYAEGDVVSSPYDLNKMFPGKFKVLSGPGKVEVKTKAPKVVETEEFEPSGLDGLGQEEAPVESPLGEGEPPTEEEGGEDDIVRRPKKKKKKGNQ